MLRMMLILSACLARFSVAKMLARFLCGRIGPCGPAASASFACFGTPYAPK
jgi:hypothetical protein